MKITENFDLSQYSSFKIGGLGMFLLEIENDEDLKEALDFIKEKQLPIHVLGEGSNTIFNDNLHKKIFIKLVQKDIIKTYENEEFVNLIVSAGVNWDDLVKWTVDNNYSGFEALSLIPGSVGASPVQNIGAYGQEVSNLITYVKVLDLENNEILEIPNLECQFSYRNSLFKKNPNKFIILEVAFRLFKKEPEIPNYPDVLNYFKNGKADLQKIRKAIVEIRESKLPDIKKIPNCGSFFENPVIDKFQLSKILMRHLDMPHFDLGEKSFKLYAGWLIEKCELKGFDFGNIKIDEKNALVLINKGGATFKDLNLAIEKIISTVKSEFDIILVPEPNLIN